MQNQTGHIRSARPMAILIAALFFTVTAASVFADEPKAFNTGASMADNLKMSAGKTVAVHLRSGEALTGIVESVGANFLHLSQLSGKAFYDALIRIEDISAVDKRVRGMKK